jgi:hypothetical protein
MYDRSLTLLLVMLHKENPKCFLIKVMNASSFQQRLPFCFQKMMLRVAAANCFFAHFIFKNIFIFDCFLEMKVEMKIFMQKGILSNCAFFACVRIGSFSSWIKCWPSDLSSFLFASNHCIRLMTVLRQKTFFPSG